MIGGFLFCFKTFHRSLNLFAWTTYLQFLMNVKIYLKHIFVTKFFNADPGWWSDYQNGLGHDLINYHPDLPAHRIIEGVKVLNSKVIFVLKWDDSMTICSFASFEIDRNRRQPAAVSNITIREIGYGQSFHEYFSHSKLFGAKSLLCETNWEKLTQQTQKSRISEINRNLFEMFYKLFLNAQDAQEVMLVRDAILQNTSAVL